MNDGAILRLIGQWLHVGVLEEGQVVNQEIGTPQGAPVSPILANIFLHVVLDEWFHTEVKPRMKGNCFLVRYADDCAPRVQSGPMRWLCAQLNN
jgi:retron-type reverse transcriptase